MNTKNTVVNEVELENVEEYIVTKVSPGTIARTVFMIITIANSALAIFGKEKLTPTVGEVSNLNLFKKDDMDPNNVWNRTVSSWEVGVNVSYLSYFLGFSFNRDFEKISVNMKQVQAFGIKAGYIF
jgi:hypothetical protein